MQSKFTKKPVTIEAEIWTGKNRTDVLKFCPDCYVNFDKGTDVPELKIKTLEGVMTASIGDYIIKGIKGEFYPCKPDIFEITYDKAN